MLQHETAVSALLRQPADWTQKLFEADGRTGNSGHAVEG